MAKIYDDWWEAVNDPDTDAIVIGTWPYLHCRVTLAALDAGKHVLCEARMAMNADEAYQMYEASLRNPDQVAQLVPAPFGFPVDGTVRRLLDEGYLGELRVVNVRHSGGFLQPDAPLHWRQDYALSGMNILWLGIWYEVLLGWVGEATRVTALGQTFIKTRPDDSGRRRAVRVPDHVDVLAQLACGAQAHFQMSGAMGHSGPNGVWLFGSQGTLHFDFDAETLYGGQAGDKALQPIAVPPEEVVPWRVEEEFINAIRGQEEVTRTPFAVGVQYMEFTEAVNRSIATGEAVPLPL
jgi:predicted dehydrogenase